MGKLPFAGKIAVVTGASGGIGAAIAEQLCTMGADVVLAARSERKLAALAARLGEKAHPLGLDVSDEESVAQAFERLYERYGRIDILVNNAGFGRFETVTATTGEMLRSMMDVNFFGTVYCTRAVLPRMMANRSGSIVNVASVAGKMATAKAAGYSATKHAVLGFTNALRQELHGSGVHVMAVNPGPVQTGFFDIADPGGGYVNRVRAFMVTPERVARAAVNGIVRGKAEVHVPWWFGVAVKAVHLLPASLVNAVAVRFLSLK